MKVFEGTFSRLPNGDWGASVQWGKPGGAVRLTKRDGSQVLMALGQRVKRTAYGELYTLEAIDFEDCK